MKLFAASLIVAAIVACGGDGSTTPVTTDPAVGQYVLQTVGGQSLPAVVSQNNVQTTTVTSGTMDLNAAGAVMFTYDTQTVPASGQPSQRTNEAQGTWIRTGSGLSLKNVTVNGGPEIAVEAVESSTGITLRGSLFTENGGDFFFRKNN